MQLKWTNCWSKWNLSHVITFEYLENHTGYLWTNASECLVYRWFPLNYETKKLLDFKNISRVSISELSVIAFSFFNVFLLIFFCISIYFIGNLFHLFYFIVVLYSTLQLFYNYSTKSKTLYYPLILFSVIDVQLIWQ